MSFLPTKAPAPVQIREPSDLVTSQPQGLEVSLPASNGQGYGYLQITAGPGAGSLVPCGGKRVADAVMDMLIVAARADVSLNRIVLDKKDYLQLAFEMRQYDPNAPIRVISIGTAYAVVRFCRPIQFQGPNGGVAIFEAP